MEPNNINQSVPVSPTHKHVALLVLLFILLLVATGALWFWTTKSPVNNQMIEGYNKQLEQSTVQQSGQTNDQNAAANQALESDINSSLNLEVESDLKSIDLEF